jgi:hypothetical protein
MSRYCALVRGATYGLVASAVAYGICTAIMPSPTSHIVVPCRFTDSPSQPKLHCFEPETISDVVETAEGSRFKAFWLQNQTPREFVTSLSKKELESRVEKALKEKQKKDR